MILATHYTGELRELWQEAWAQAAKKRGGPQLLETIRGDVSDDALLEHLLKRGALHVEVVDGSVVGFAIVRDAIIEALYVAQRHRREGLARLMVKSLRQLVPAPVDAFALPGDRATKSLYESFGWKARLLTMHVE